MNPPQNSVNESFILVNPPQNSVDESFILVNPPQNFVDECLNWMNPPQNSVNESFILVNPPQNFVDESLIFVNKHKNSTPLLPLPPLLPYCRKSQKKSEKRTFKAIANNPRKTGTQVAVKLSSIRHLLPIDAHALRLPGTNPDCPCLRCCPGNTTGVCPKFVCTAE